MTPVSSISDHALKTRYFPSALQLIAAQQRNRSTSPRKVFGQKTAEIVSGSRSRSPAKKQQQQWAKTLDYLQPQCRLEGCSAAILVEDVRFLVCKHQLSHSSDFFRALFLKSHALPMEGVRHLREDEYLIQVSSLRHPPQALQFQWFLETTVPSPMLRDISDDLLETCMRLCKRFAARGLEMRCTKFIKERVESKPPLMALCWLNWSFKHHFHRSVQEACLPVVARLSLLELEKHRQMLPEAVFADLLAMKLRTAYQQTSTVFHTIHRMDHFRVDMAQCPRCGRQREQGRIRVQASPCHKLIGCERCLREYQCELGDEDTAIQMQAFWQCEHGLWPFSEKTEDCRCQTFLYKTNTGQQNQSPLETTTNKQQKNKSPSSSTFPNLSITYNQQQNK
uniref:BTB domain-containing protein n=1 Tax=Meloidogyne incognita TaxID=6306 RepID=A0A914L7P0_MELIC